MSTHANIHIADSIEQFDFYIHWDGMPEVVIPTIREALNGCRNFEASKETANLVVAFQRHSVYMTKIPGECEEFDYTIRTSDQGVMIDVYDRDGEGGYTVPLIEQ